MRLGLWTFFVAMLFMVFTTPSAADWPERDVYEAMGLKPVAENATEVRIWYELSSSLGPSELFRVRKAGERYEGGWILWARLKEAYPDGVTPAEARKYNRLTKKYMKKKCKNKIISAGTIVWCAGRLKSEPKWEVLFDDLLPERYWELPAAPPRDCGWTRFDGHTVGIEIVKGQRRHRVAYSNPDFCCGHFACAIANHVHTVVRSQIR